MGKFECRICNSASYSSKVNVGPLSLEISDSAHVAIHAPSDQESLFDPCYLDKAAEILPGEQDPWGAVWLDTITRHECLTGSGVDRAHPANHRRCN